MHYLKPSLVRCRMLRYPKPFEQFLEVILLRDVVIIPQHRQEQALAEPARTDKEKEVPCLFHRFDIHAFVYQIQGFVPDLTEIRYAVRKCSISCHILMLFFHKSKDTNYF